MTKKIENLDIPHRAKSLIKDWGIEELYPPQAKAVDGILEGQNSVCAYPTASGKTLLAYLAIIKQVISNNGKALYIVPLRALASEKAEELKKFEEIGISTSVSMGNYNEVNPNLSEHDVIVATSEKADSLLRHNVEWIHEIDVIVADEVHLVDDRERGSTLEVTLTKLKDSNPSAQILALSATISNSEDIAEWLDAKHYSSTWRPVELRKAVNYKSTVVYENGEEKSIEQRGDEVESLVMPTLEKGHQSLVFVNSRRSTQKVARDLHSKTKNVLTSEEKEKLENIAKEIHSASSTDLGKNLARYVRRGTAFHHAGLNNEQRSLVESAFKRRLIKVISATPTLAAGVNIPARQVVIRDCKRYDGTRGGMVPLPVMEIQQMLGRAGRPDYDDVGEAVLVAKCEDDLDNYLDKYIKGDSERVDSQLGHMPSLRMHLMALIATGYANTKEEIMEFGRKTFHAVNHSISAIENEITETIELLTEESLVKTKGERLLPTKFGKLISNLYIDPLSGIQIKRAFKKRKDEGLEPDPLSYLHVASHTPDMYTLYLKNNEFEQYQEELYLRKEKTLLDIPVNDPSRMQETLESLKTSYVLKDWINERDEEDMRDEYGVGPGDIHQRVDTAQWLVSAMHRISKLFSTKDREIVRRLEARLQHGVQKELLPLTKIRGIGRVRGRELYEKGIKTEEQVRNTPPRKLMDIPSIGQKLATKLSDRELKEEKPAQSANDATERGEGQGNSFEDGQNEGEGQTKLTSF